MYSLKLNIKYTYRIDGLGNKVQGWYLTIFGMPIGCAYKTKDAALKTIPMYIADVKRQVCL